MYERGRARSQGNMPPRLKISRSRRWPQITGRRLLGVASIILFLLGIWCVARVYSFLQAFNAGNPLLALEQQLNPPVGSVGWKIEHGQQVSLLLLGYGGDENDAPYLTDSDLVLEINPNNHRVVMASIPRDLKAKICPYSNGHCLTNKINVAYAAGKDDGSYPHKESQFTASNTKDSGGNLAKQTFGKVTGLSFDGYVGVDFKAFRDVVDALGGVQVCLTGPLDDYQYPDYHDGYIKGGIHFKAGCQQLNGEQALEVARSRHAIQGVEASDFGRIKRQQLILNGIRKKANSLNAVNKAPQLMDALQQDFSTDLTLTDLRILFQWSKEIPDSSVGKLSIDFDNFLYACDNRGEYYECATDPSYESLHRYFGNLLVDPKTLQEKTPVQIANASHSLNELGSQVSAALNPLGFNTVDPVRLPMTEGSTVYDYSGGKGKATAQWMADYFGAHLVEVKAGTAPPTPNPPPSGVVVALGRQFALSWVGKG